MSELILKEITVHDGAGKPSRALLRVCPDCANETFLIYGTMPGSHIHMQCAVCGTSFCDGSCAEEETPK